MTVSKFTEGELVWFEPADPDSRAVILPGYYEVQEVRLPLYRIENDHHGWFWAHENELDAVEYDREEEEQHG